MAFNCLFDALSAYTRYDGYQMRALICDYLAKDPVLAEGGIRASHLAELDARNLRSYVKKMRNPMTWGGETEILAFTNMFKCRVWVHTHGMKPLEYVPLQPYKHTIHVFYTGNHYEILGRERPKK